MNSLIWFHFCWGEFLQLLKCLSKDSSSLIKIPRTFDSFLCSIFSLLKICTLQVPLNTSKSVLEQFALRRLIWSPFSYSSASSLTFLDTSEWFWAVTTIEVSSAYWKRPTLSGDIVEHVINILQRTPTCGTPILEVKGSPTPTVLFTLILRVHFLRKIDKSGNREPWIPRQCILYNSPCSHIESEHHL